MDDRTSSRKTVPELSELFCYCFSVPVPAWNWTWNWKTVPVPTVPVPTVSVPSWNCFLILELFLIFKFFNSVSNFLAKEQWWTFFWWPIYLTHSRWIYSGAKDIGGFACERGFSAFWCHTYRTVFEPFNFHQKARCQTYRTLPTPLSMSFKYEKVL